MLMIDLAWLLFGVAMKRALLRPTTERALNLCLAAMILGWAGWLSCDHWRILP